MQIRNDDVSIAIKELTRVSGIGPAKAKELYDSGVTGIDVLLKNQDKLNHHQKLGLKYIVDLLPLQLSFTRFLFNFDFCRYLNDFEQKIPRNEIAEVEQIIKKTLHNLDPNYKVTICGSYRSVVNISFTSNCVSILNQIIFFYYYYRRGKEYSGDIDTLISHPEFTSKDAKKKNDRLQVVVDVLKSKNLITETISLGELKFMVIFMLNKIYIFNNVEILLF